MIELYPEKLTLIYRLGGMRTCVHSSILKKIIDRNALPKYNFIQNLRRIGNMS